MEIGPLCCWTYANDLKRREKDDCGVLVYNALLRVGLAGIFA